MSRNFKFTKHLQNYKVFTLYVGYMIRNCNRKSNFEISLKYLSRVGVFHWMNETLLSYFWCKQFEMVCGKAWMLILNAIMMKFQRCQAPCNTILESYTVSIAVSYSPLCKCNWKMMQIVLRIINNSKWNDLNDFCSPT